MTRKQIINRLVIEDCDAVKQWVFEGEYELLFEYIKGLTDYDALSDESLMSEARHRQVID